MSGPASRADAWDASRWRWDAYYAAIAVITLILVLGSATVPARLAISAVFAVMAGWYVLAGRPAMFGDRARPWLGEAYLAGLLPLFAVTAAVSVTNTFILLALCPQCFMAVSFRRAVAAVIILNATPPLTALARGGQHAAGLTNLVAAALLGIAFSLVYGSWTIKIIEQSAERRQLIEQLEAARASLDAAARQAGALAERARLAGDIHDTIAQGLTSVLMLIQAADSAIAAAPARARAHLALAADAARDSLAEVRGLVAGLAPAQLAAGTIDDALRRLAGQAGRELPAGAGFEVRGTPRPLATATEVVLLRVCQEALANVRKHAGATRASVCLDYGDGEVALEIGDDGTGFDLAAGTGGFGLRGMRSRAGQAGGQLAVCSAAGRGTTIRVAVPG